MSWQLSRIFTDSAKAMVDGNGIVINKGGTRSGKTWSLLQLLYIIADRQQGVLISVVGETLPFLKRGAMRDFKSMLGNTWQDQCWNATDNIYTLPSTGSRIEFFSADNEGRVHGSARDYLFINECYFIKHEIFRQLAVRTRKTIFLDYNPRSRFWVDDKLLGRDDVRLIKSNYMDNPHLSPRQIAEIESNKGDENWWRVYGLGETGSVEGLVYTNYDIVPTMPTIFKREFFCIDFGFSNDPTAILHVCLSGGDLHVDEIAYGIGMSNADIAQALREAGATRATSIVCDSAEPKSIADINTHGFHAVPCTKGAGSITAGITAVQGYKLHITQRSLGTIEELRNYMWKRDINGSYINQPIDKYNHALDALRYGVTTFLWAKGGLKKPRSHFYES